MSEDPNTGPTQAEMQIAQVEQRYGELLQQKRAIDRQMEAARASMAHQRSAMVLVEAELKEIEGHRNGVAMGKQAAEAEHARASGKKAS